MSLISRRNIVCLFNGYYIIFNLTSARPPVGSMAEK